MPTYDPTITPTAFYLDPMAAMAFLEQAFGFETVLLVTDADGKVGHAEMAYHGAVIGIGGEWSGAQLGGAAMRSPQSLGGAGTQFMWVKVNDPDAHCARARAAGARITQEPEEQFYGARTYRALDPEGHVWCFTKTVRAVPEEEMHGATGLEFRHQLTP